MEKESIHKQIKWILHHVSIRLLKCYFSTYSNIALQRQLDGIELRSLGNFPTIASLWDQWEHEKNVFVCNQSECCSLIINNQWIYKIDEHWLSVRVPSMLASTYYEKWKTITRIRSWCLSSFSFTWRTSQIISSNYFKLLNNEFNWIKTVKLSIWMSSWCSKYVIHSRNGSKAESSNTSDDDDSNNNNDFMAGAVHFCSLKTLPINSSLPHPFTHFHYNKHWGTLSNCRKYIYTNFELERKPRANVERACMRASVSVSGVASANSKFQTQLS